MDRGDSLECGVELTQSGQRWLTYSHKSESSWDIHCMSQWRSSESVSQQHNMIRINWNKTRIRIRKGIGLGYESALSRLPDVYRLSKSRADNAVTPNTNKVYCACSSWVEEKSYCAHSGHRSRTQVKSSSFDWPGLRMCRNGHRRNLTAHARIAISEHREWTQVKSSSRLDWTLETLERQIRYNWHITLTIIARTGSLYNLKIIGG